MFDCREMSMGSCLMSRWSGLELVSGTLCSLTTFPNEIAKTSLKFGK